MITSPASVSQSATNSSPASITHFNSRCPSCPYPRIKETAPTSHISHPHRSTSSTPDELLLLRLLRTSSCRMQSTRASPLHLTEVDSSPPMGSTPTPSPGYRTPSQPFPGPSRLASWSYSKAALRLLHWSSSKEEGVSLQAGFRS